MPCDIEGQNITALENAEHIAATCRRFLELKGSGLSMSQAARQLKKPVAWFSGADCYLERFLRDDFAGLLPAPRDTSAMVEVQTPPWFIPAAQYFYLLSNLRRDGGSIPEAILRVAELPQLPFGWTKKHGERLLKYLKLETLPTCPVDLRLRILDRHNRRKPLLPPRLARQIALDASTVQYSRSPRAWSLDNLCAPGSQRRYFNEATGQREIMQPGDFFSGDDTTPGLAVCVPTNEILTPCSEKFGVLLGRFQWLAYIDCRTDKILASEHVIRPRGSYRGEDILNGMKSVTRANQIPRVGWQFEGGSWNCKLVRHAMQLMGVHHWRTYSPHQKAIERIFNKVWTRLAVQFPHANLGRFRNEYEENCRIYEQGKQGHEDPRKYFPSLSIVVQVFDEEVLRHNAERILSRQYGSWVPNEFFDSYTKQIPLREFSRDMDFIFAPWAVERKVQGMIVKCRVKIFEDFGVDFEFTAPWLPRFHGKQVRLHFDPREPKCNATVVLLENCSQRRAGEVLGKAKLVGETAQHVRRILDYANDDQRAGYRARQGTAHFARRVSRGFGNLGRIQYSADEQRDGLGRVTKIERDNRPADLRPEIETPQRAELPPELAELCKVRRGKIQSLPADIREEICDRLASGQSQKVVLGWANENQRVKEVLAVNFDGVSINACNMSDFFKSDFPEYLRQKQTPETEQKPTLEERKRRSEELKQIALDHQFQIP